jgi:translation elongation factor EF-1alpha
MGIAIAALRAKAAEEFPGLDIDLESGETIRLVAVTELSDEQLDRFTDAQNRLSDSDEQEDLKGLRRTFVEVLALVSTNPDRAREVLANESLGVLIVVFREYSKTVSDGSKSEDAA